MYCNCSQTLIRLLRRHLPRRGRQSAAAGIWTDRGVRPYKVQCWNRIESVSERRCAERRDLSGDRDRCNGRRKAEIF